MSGMSATVNRMHSRAMLRVDIGFYRGIVFSALLIS